MALLVVNHVGGYLVRHPDGDVEAQRDFDLRDGDDRVCGVDSPRLPADIGFGQKIGNALRLFAWGERRHIGRRCGGIKRAGGESDRLLADYRRRAFPRHAGKMKAGAT